MYLIPSSVAKAALCFTFSAVLIAFNPFRVRVIDYKWILETCMARYILGRLAGMLFSILAASLITFFLMHSVPGGPFDETKMPLPEAAKASPSATGCDARTRRPLS